MNVDSAIARNGAMSDSPIKSDKGQVDHSYKYGDNPVLPPRRIHFLHHHDRPNIGDILSGPSNYFNYGDYSKVSWDKQVIGDVATGVKKGDILIMGGGIFFTKDKKKLDAIISRSSLFIGWGLGLDSRISPNLTVNKYSLLGTRERKSEYINNKNVLYVPCASCMNSAFDALDDDVSTDIAVHINGGFNDAKIRKIFPNAPITTTVNSFSEVIKNISSALCVVTNSYHGAYWSALMGKKVVLLPTEVPKWSGLPEEIEVSTASDLIERTKIAKNVPNDYLQECRQINVNYDVLVKERIFNI